jgi:hypothetical protein
VNQLQTQTHKYWVTDFQVDDSDIEQIYNHLLEAEVPQTAEQIARVIIDFRVVGERNRIKQLLAGRRLYQPKESHQIGDEIVFPALKYTHGAVKSIREGYDPRYGRYDVVSVSIGDRTREFASGLPGEHKLNLDNGDAFEPGADIDLEELNTLYGYHVTESVAGALQARNEFVCLGEQWFVTGLMADVNIGHLHLAEAVLEMSEGGPLSIDDIMVHLDLDDGLEPVVQRFSLNHALSKDDRFDEVGPPGEVAWFLMRLEPDAVRVVPERLHYEPISFDRALLSPQLLLLERELDDEWSDLKPAEVAQPTILSLTYPHRWAGTLPLSSRTRPLFPIGTSPRQRVVLFDEQSKSEVKAWIVDEHRYIYGLGDWYEQNNIPVGGFITLKPGPETGVVLLDYDRRRPKREWVRLANVVDGTRLEFELERRSVGCGYDDLLIVGTDYVAAVDVLARRIESNQWSLTSLLINIFPSLAKLNPQETVHTKTLYSAINMLKRVSPGPLFAELIKHPAFQPVGDHYWHFEQSLAR